MKHICIFIIKIYQKFISPLFGAQCRFYPTCSQYGLEAFSRFGFFKGGYLTLRRILRCNPFCEGGIDPVPEKKENAEKKGRS